MKGQSSGVLYSATFTYVLLLSSVDSWVTALHLAMNDLSFWFTFTFSNSIPFLIFGDFQIHVSDSSIILVSQFLESHTSKDLLYPISAIHSISWTLILPIATTPQSTNFTYPPLSGSLMLLANHTLFLLSIHSPTLLHNYFLLSLLSSNTSFLILSLSWWPCFLFQHENWSNQ